MALINNSLESLYGGVNQQSAEFRLKTQVKEMINALPTINAGLQKRNPTQHLVTSQVLTYEKDMFSTEYDRGISGGVAEQYSINITSAGMEIVNIQTGKVYNKTNGITYIGVAEAYLTPFGGKNGYSAVTVKDTTFITNKLVTPIISNSGGNSTYLKKSYIWLISANPASPYTYTATITDSLGNTVTTNASATTTTAAATALASNINIDANYTAVAIGSVIEVTGINNISTCEVSDTFGNQASKSWVTNVQYTTDLPKNMGFNNVVVKITGSGSNTFASYWLEYVNSSWIETKQPDYSGIIDATTMPHILIRNANDTFTFQEYGNWIDLKVGDSNSNKLPSFTTSTIKDIFFFKNRLGFITETNVLLSEVGEYGNFFRTTTAAVLDSDPIDTTVDTTKVINLEYATYLEDSVMLFSDKAQFKLSGGRILSPKSAQISQTSSYEINKDVRPIFINDKIFFVATRGNYSAIMQYEVQYGGTSYQAIDISAHVQSYIPADVQRLSGSPINNMLFITTTLQDDTIYVYKYYDNGKDRIQSAWFKWNFNGKIYNAFALGKNLNIMIDRLPNNQFETMAIAPQDYNGSFYDNGTIPFKVDVNFGKWVHSSRITGKDNRGHLLFKTVQVSSEIGSDFELYVKDLNRNTTRTIQSKYTVNRKPMVYGNAKNIEVGISSTSNKGFKINSVSYEGALSQRSRKL